MGVAPHNLSNIVIWNLRGKSKPMNELAPSLIRRALKDRPIAVIIDPIYKVITGDENSADQMAAFCNQFDKVADSLGCAVIYCHHHSKGSQGTKRAVDRASGSGVFARDPDAILDMIELHVTDDLRKAREGQALVKLCTKTLAEIDYNGQISAKISDDDKLVGEKFFAAIRSFVGDEAAFLNRVVNTRKAVHAETAWRIEGTLREFPRFDPVQVWFDYPTHEVDTTGMLSDAMTEGEALPMSEYRKQGREKKAQRDKGRQAEKLKALREGMEQCAIDGVEPTIQAVVERMPEVGGKQITVNSVRLWVQKNKNPWCPVISVNNGNGTRGVLVDKSVEDMKEGF